MQMPLARAYGNCSCWDQAQQRAQRLRHMTLRLEEGIPVALAQGVQAKFVCNLRSIHGIWQILLVGEHKQNSVTQLILRKTKTELRKSMPSLHVK